MLAADAGTLVGRGARRHTRAMTDAAPTPPCPPTSPRSPHHLTPVLGRYFERSWSHGEGHRLYDTSGKAYLDFANGIAVTALGHAHPRVTAAIHAQVDRLIGPTGAMGYAEPVVAPGRRCSRRPCPTRSTRHVPELRARRRSTAP